ncbi:MAG TPA: chromosome partitioning protein ParA [Deltaproteobacteria bacterium]|nr:chromosome partitioning protein ParA [Deltaproteobacteria bacterium]
MDIHGPSVPKLLGITEKRVTVQNEEIVPVELSKNTKVVSMGLLLDASEQAIIWRGPLKANVIREFIQNVAWGDLDCLVVDCPPGTGDEPLSVAQLMGSISSAIIVTTPQEVATIDVEKCITFCKHLNLPIAGIIENMSGFVCPDCGKEVDIFSSGGGKKLAEKFSVPFLGKIPLDPDIVKSGDEGKPYLYFYSTTRTAQKFDEIVEQIVNSGKEKQNVGQNEAAIQKTLEDTSEQHKEVSMKFAVPTYQGKLCAHFGHCEAFAIIDTDSSGKVIKEVYENSPPHEPGLLPRWLSQKGVNCVIAGGMGSRAQQLFAQQGVMVVTGAQGEYPRDVVEQYLKGTLQTGANTCDH